MPHQVAAVRAEVVPIEPDGPKHLRQRSATDGTKTALGLPDIAVASEMLDLSRSFHSDPGLREYYSEEHPEVNLFPVKLFSLMLNRVNSHDQPGACAPAARIELRESSYN